MVLPFLQDNSTAWSPGLWEDLPFEGSVRNSKPISQGEITYNGYKLEDDNNNSTICFWPNEDIMVEVSKREKEAGIIPDLDIDTYMKNMFYSSMGYICALSCNFSQRTKRKPTNRLHTKGHSFLTELKVNMYPVIDTCLTWTCLTYYVIGYSPEAERFFPSVHSSFCSAFIFIIHVRFLASVFQTNNASMTAGSFAILIVLVFSGFIITQSSMPVWLKWGFWVSPITYGEMGLSLNEFLAPRWQKMLSTNNTIGQEILESRGLNFDGYLYWISLGALFGFIIVFNIGYVLALTFLKSPGSSRAVISHEKLSQIQGSEDSRDGSCLEKKYGNSPAQNGIEPNKGFINFIVLLLILQIITILGLDICADTLVGDAMRRGISGGQKKRLTTGEMIVGPTKALFMDEITNGLDSSTAFQIVSCLQQLVHITDATVLVSLLQPAPETFDIFDDLILMSKGRLCIMVHLVITACITMTVFLRTRMDIDILHANYYMGSLFYALIILLVDAIPELSMTIQRLEVFYKQKTFCFYPAWAYAIPASILKVPISFVESLVWNIPLEMRVKGFTNKKLQILSDITGAFKPGVLTALMGVSGAGKTTLLDVLAGRKTSGYIEGHIKIGGYPKVQETFARVSGYCEQTDIHSPQITVEESVIFSAWLRLSPQIDSKTKAEFVNEVLETIELDGIKDALVGIPGINGLSNEQRKRLTIAVELVSNPSAIFMDEPTTGLGARAAAIVMRAVKNVADTGRTIVCTIHQPSIDIFEAFDELILLKSGGHVIYSGSLGQHSACVIEYFESIPGVPKIRNNYNPATWMLEVTSISAEVELGADFAQKYRDSVLYEKNMELVRQLSSPPLGSTDLYFPTRFSQNGWGQLKSCLWKQHLAYWRSPAYNLMRIMHTLVTALIFGVLYWDEGKKLNNQQNLFNIFGSMYVAVLFLGINNCSTVLPYVATERTIMYREIFAGMYFSWAYSLAQVVVEIPYLFIETTIFVTISYPMIGYYGSAYKVFWYFYTIFCSLLSFNYLGMLLVSLTPNFMVATILASAFYTTFNLFAGFLIPKPQIPKWWIWMYYLTPTSWSLNGMLTSQYGDINKKIVVFGETKTVVAFLEDYFGYHHDQLAIVAVVLIAFPLVFASLFSYFIGQLKFQHR
ncbi:pleiotropic drug resistance protein 3 [Quercus suber]|uniref:Pleiotropic drug resistance protein 3 n=1 Tax=Quercus suber TaxID=58331 RepID=A0AAW0LBQ7_QUESU